MDQKSKVINCVNVCNQIIENLGGLKNVLFKLDGCKIHIDINSKNPNLATESFLENYNPQLDEERYLNTIIQYGIDNKENIFIRFFLIEYLCVSGVPVIDIIFKEKTNRYELKSYIQNQEDKLICDQHIKDLLASQIITTFENISSIEL